MANNAGLSADVMFLQTIDSKGFEGINFSTGQRVDLKAEGILDPAKVTRCALKNAVSVASALLLTNHSIVLQ